MMDKLKIYIVEDEMITSESLSDMLEELGYEVTGSFIRAKTALAAIEKDQPDFLLLDIRLKGEETGIWLAEEVKKTWNIPYIFLTSYGDKATVEKATQTAPYGYLLKPVEKQNLYAAIEVALKKFGEQHVGASEEEARNFLLNDAMFIKDEYLYVKVYFKDINFIKANGNYLEIHIDKKKHLIKGTISSIAESLPQELFFQPHRSYLINFEKIEAFGANYVKVNGTDIPLAGKKKEELLSAIQLYKN